MAKNKNKSKRQKARKQVVPRQLGSGMSMQEAQLARLIADPCHAPLVGGFGLGTRGIVQRFTRLYTVAETDWQNPEFSVYVNFNLAQNGIIISQFRETPDPKIDDTILALPHWPFLENNADQFAVLAGCVEIMYTGPVLERKGLIGVCQAKAAVLLDSVFPYGGGERATLGQRLAYSQAVAPVPQQATSVKWIPTVQNMTGGANNEATLQTDDNRNSNAVLMSLSGVNKAHFIIRVTSVVEYVPKVALGQLAPRPTINVPPGAPQRIAAAMDRGGAWWHNIGEVAHAGMRYAAGAFHALESGVRLVKGVARMAPAAAALLM